MNSLQLELTKLIGKKELTRNCMVNIPTSIQSLCENSFVTLNGGEEFSYKGNTPYRIKDRDDNGVWTEIIGHPASETDFKKWMNEKGLIWEQRDIDIKIFGDDNILIPYDSSKGILDQSTETLSQILELIKTNS